LKKDLYRKQIMEIKPYVPGKPIEEVERELGITNVIKLASNENPLGPSPLAVEAMTATIPKVSIYPDGNCYYLKNALSAHLGVAMDHLIVGNGSDEILKLITEAFLNEGEEAVVGNPTFSEYDFSVKIMGGKTVAVPLKDHVHDLSAMRDAVTDNTKLVFVCNPNNPTGTTVKRQKLAKLIDSLPQGVITVLDEAYYEYVTDPDYGESLDFVHQGKDVIVLRTFSKIYGLAGLRVGYGVARPDLIGSLLRVKEPFNVNMMAQAAALAALEDGEHVERSRTVNEEGKKYLAAEFTRLGLTYAPTQANFIWVNIAADCRTVFNKLLGRGVIVRTGDIFGAPDVLRITVGTPEQNERLIGMLEEVLAEENVAT
jgi:histidinol-phosphate aminotransferase